MAYYTTIPSPLGNLTLASDGEALTGLWLEGQKYFPGFSEADQVQDDLPIFQKAKAWLADYFNRRSPSIDFPLNPQGSDFRQAVWRILLAIPYGETRTYGDIARELAQTRRTPVSAQAVGGAVGRNPISILIPCHRVMGADGSLTGYAGGVEKKQWLLRHENAF